MRLINPITILLLASGSSFAVDNSGTLSLQLFDSLTGLHVSGLMKIEGPESTIVRTTTSGSLTVQLRPGAYREVFCASGYKPLKGHTTVQLKFSTKFTVMLDPVAPPNEESPEAIQGHVRPGFTLLHGYVQDNDFNNPIAGAILRVGKAEAKTDVKGHFYLAVPTPKPNAPYLIGTGTLICEKSGYKTDITPDLGILDEEMGPIRRGLDKGTGQVVHGEGRGQGHGTGIGQDSSEPSESSLSPELLKWLGTPATDDDCSSRPTDRRRDD